MTGGRPRSAAPAWEPWRRMLLCVLFAFVVIHAASSDVTWDEAWTALFYGRSPLGFTRLDYANDHPLHSFLVWLAWRLFGESELILRLPNVAACGLYLWSTGRLLGRVRLWPLALGLCLMHSYLMDYFALARGYGIAAALVQVGLVEHLFVTDRRRLGLLLLCVLLASLTIFSTVLVLFGLIGAHVLTTWTERDAHRPALRLPLCAVFAAAGLAPVAGLAWVSRPEMPLYGSENGFFDAVLRGIARMYVPAPWATAAVVGLLAALAGIGFAAGRAASRRTVMLLLAAGWVLAATWCASWLLHKPLPTGRVLLPWMPLLNLTVLAWAEDALAASGAGARAALRGGSAILCAALAVLFLHRLHFQRYADWPEDRGLQSRLARGLAARRHCLPQDVWERYGHVYYLDRWFPPGEKRPPDVSCKPGGP